MEAQNSRPGSSGGERTQMAPIWDNCRNQQGRVSIRRRPSNASNSYDIPDSYANLDELASSGPVGNPDEDDAVYPRQSLEASRSREQEYIRQKEEGQRRSGVTGPESPSPDGDQVGEVPRVSVIATRLYVTSYLVFFSLLGTLARLGLQAITFYPGTPVLFSEVWANFGGSVFMGFLSEDRMLFRNEWGTPLYDQKIKRAKEKGQDEESGSGSDHKTDLQAAKRAHAAVKKTIPLYIGLATGFCGCFTSFSSFIRDAYLAMSNAQPMSVLATSSAVPRSGGYSFMALLGVLIVTISLCISGLYLGAHLAIVLEPYTPSLPFYLCRKLLDRLIVVLAWGCWMGAVIVAIIPPDRFVSDPEKWRGRALFAVVFAPVGCLGRFYASLYLNGRMASFPLGTFVVNIFGTAILGMSYDLQHVPLGGVIGCQLLQGIEDGFCGCLTTVSTWVSELSSLKRRHAYRYGAASVAVALCFLIAIMGSLQWTRGFSELKCSH